MGSYELYNGRVSDDVFFSLLYARWRSFGQMAAKQDALTIFECAFMQNHVNELLFWREVSANEIIAHHNRLIDSVRALSPVLIYLSQPDVRETVLRVASERVSPDGDKWIDRVVEYCESSKFGKRNNIKGLDSALEFFAIRKELEMKIIDQLDIPCAIIENADCDWAAIWAEAGKFLLQVE